MPPARKVQKTDVGKREYQRSSTLAVKDAKGRKSLIDAKAARSAAKAKATRLQKRGLYTRGYSEEEGAALKKGLEGMARRVNLDEETYNRVMAMDEMALAALYKNDDIVFEVMFSYSGIETDPDTGAYVYDDSKRAEFDFLIEQYNRLFPESAV